MQSIGTLSSMTLGGVFMRSNNKHTAEEFEVYIQLFLKERFSYHELKNNYVLLLNKSKYRFKVLKYQTHGLDGISSKTINNHYSSEFKYSVIEQHLKLGAYIAGLAAKYSHSNY